MVKEHGNRDASLEWTRRRFIATAAGAALAAPRAMFAKSNDASRPNFLWIDVEDMGPHQGCYGNTYMKTPYIDQLAKEGVRFLNFGGPCCICGPNRASFITGMYPTTIGAHQMRCDAVEDATIKILPDYFRDAGYYCANRMKTDYQGLTSGTEGGKDHWDIFGDTADYSTRPSGSNFWFQRNWGGTHEGMCWEPREKARDNMELPPYYPDTDLARRIWEKYLFNIEWLDFDGVGKLLEGLKTDGLEDSTIVFFFGDHGQGFPRAKRWLYDSGLLAPLIVRIPEKFRTDGQGVPGTVSDELVSFMDLAPTMLNLAGIPIPSHMQGRAFLGPNLSAPSEYLFAARDRADERYELIRMVRDKRYKYIRNYNHWKEYYQWYEYAEKGMMTELRRARAAGELKPDQEMWFTEHKPLEELYDTKEDPHEMKNLASSASHKDILDRMRAAHVKWVLDTHDLGFIPEGILDERAKAAGSHYKVATRDSGAESKRAFEAACLLAKGADGLAELTAALDSADSAVRYWAALGLGNLLDKAASAKSKLQAALSDTEPLVRIAAARSLAFMGESTAIATLAAEASDTNNNSHTRLEALNYIDRLGKLAKDHIANLTDTIKDNTKCITQIIATIDNDPQYPGIGELAIRGNKSTAKFAGKNIEWRLENGRLLVRSLAAEPVHAALFDASGRSVSSMHLDVGRSCLLPKKRQLSRGTYVLKVTGNNLRFARRIWVQ